MALNGNDLAQKIMDAQKNINKKCLSTDIPNKSDEDLAKEGKIRVEYEGSTMIMEPDKMKSFDYTKEMGDAIIKYIKENIEFKYTVVIMWVVPAGPSTATVPDTIVTSLSSTVKIESIQNKMSGYYKSVPLFLKAIEDSILTAKIDLGSPNMIFKASSKDAFSSALKIIYTPTGDWEPNMKALGNAIVNAVKLAISTSTISCTDTVPPAISSSGTAKMILIS